MSESNRPTPIDSSIQIAAQSDGDRYYLWHDGTLFSTPAAGLKQAFALAAAEFPDDSLDDFTAVGCPECGTIGRAAYSFRTELWACEECCHSWAQEVDEA